MERIENLARILDVTNTFARDADDTRNWLSIPRINGDLTEFYKKHTEATQRSVGEFYLLDADNPTSVQSFIIAGRENARTLRALISTEMWLQINVFYGRIRALSAEKVTPDHFTAVCGMLKDGAQAHTGITEGTLYRDQAWHFYMIGRYLERADQTTRLLDTRFHCVGSAVGRCRCRYRCGAVERVAASLRRIPRLSAGTSQRIQCAGGRLLPAGEYRVPAFSRAKSGTDRVASDNAAVAVFPADDGGPGAVGSAERHDELSARGRTGGGKLSPFLDYVQREIGSLHQDIIETFAG